MQCKYGAKTVPLTKDGNAVFVKELAAVKPSLELLRSAIANGELDANIENAIKSLQKHHKLTISS